MSKHPGELHASILKILADSAQALTAAQIAAQLGYTGKRIEGIRVTLLAMLRRGAVVRSDARQPYRYRTAVSPVAKPLEPASERPTPSSETESVVEPSPPAGVEFALWDDGRLSIYDGDEVIQLPPECTERLTRLLGVARGNT